MKTRGIVTEISHETVRSYLKKTNYVHGKNNVFVFPKEMNARFVAEMEVVLDIFCSQHSPSEPLKSMDEAAIQLTGHLIEPIKMQPGHDAKEDYHYTREGTQALFMFFDPQGGWRRGT
ncbi:MAG: hypothetical protein F6J90_23745 [Moorea sp. SIOASIH]|nr:hypothetical protein [Moorena sp. SIOASIH]NEO39184.1 hypothetical protein [Moorena sp. SIOASIH]